MSNVADQQTLPQAAMRRSRRFPIIWIVPLVAVLIGAWLAWDTLSKEGPTIKISFESGEGLQAGQSQLKYKDIVFGTVKSLQLSPDHTHVVVTIATTPTIRNTYSVRPWPSSRSRTAASASISRACAKAIMLVNSIHLPS